MAIESVEKTNMRNAIALIRSVAKRIEDGIAREEDAEILRNVAATLEMIRAKM
ncbi:MAG: hypothetical protein QXT19_00950 [Candidatus Woesearchaeota archaeon]